MREAPAINIINELLKYGAKIQAYDPKAIDSAKRIFGDRIIYSKSSYDALINADCLLLLTEWNEFRRPDIEKLKEIMRVPVIFDGRNQYDRTRLENRGVKYFSIGRGNK